MENIGLYRQTTEFTIENAGTSEWCRAVYDGKQYFVKKMLSPVYPAKDIGLSEKFYKARVEEFHRVLSGRQEIYRRLNEANSSGMLVVPVDTISYQYHICTITEFIDANVPPEKVCLLSEWQRLVLLRSLTLALMNVHQAGVVHSDMKPDNVLIRQDERGNCRLFLIDFDSSYLENDAPTDPEKVHGDLAYFAPEIYRMLMEEDVRPGVQTDVFALGLVFHYLWCGKLPPKPADRTVGEHVLLSGELGFDPSVPPGLRELIRRMLAVRPEDRLPLSAVYSVLGVQVNQHPPRINILPQPETAPTQLESAPRKEVSRPSAKASPVAEKKSPPAAEIPTPRVTSAAATEPVPDRIGRVAILSVDEDGLVIARNAVDVAFGSSRLIQAKQIDGYVLVSDPAQTAKISPSGEPNGPLRFVYRPADAEPVRKHRFAKFLCIFLLALAIWLGIGYGLAWSANKNGDYQAAKTIMNFTPLCQYIFPDTYNDILQHLYSANP